MHAARGWARRSVAVGWKWRVMHSMDAEDALRLYVGGTGATAPHAMSNKLTPAACKFRGSARDTACREHKAGAHKAKGHAISRSRKKSSMHAVHRKQHCDKQTVNTFVASVHLHHCNHARRHCRCSYQQRCTTTSHHAPHRRCTFKHCLGSAP